MKAALLIGTVYAAASSKGVATLGKTCSTSSQCTQTTECCMYYTTNGVANKNVRKCALKSSAGKRNLAPVTSKIVGTCYTGASGAKSTVKSVPKKPLGSVCNRGDECAKGPGNAQTCCMRRIGAAGTPETRSCMLFSLENTTAKVG